MIAAIFLFCLVVLAVLAAPIILALLLRPALLCVDGGSRRPAHVAAAMVAWVADLVAARTTWRLLAGPLHSGELTISDSLERLVHPFNSLHPDYLLFVELAKYINRKSPTGRHIEAVL